MNNAGEFCPEAAPMRFTVFPDLEATRKNEYADTWSNLVEGLRSPEQYAKKKMAPLLKLGTFGDHCTPRGCLRHDPNMETICGVEGDYDGELVQPEVALAQLERHGVRGLIYTSASHRPDKPRWRVLAPFSGELTPERRTQMINRLNGVLDGVLTSESWTLSQTFYFGRVQGSPYQCLVTFKDPEEGTCIDELDEFDEIAIGNPKESKATEPDSTAQKPNEDMFAAKVKELGHKLRTGNGRREMVKTYIASKSARGMTDAEIRHMIAGIANLYFDPDDPIDEKNVSDLVAHFRRKDAPPAWPDPVPLPDDLPPVAAFDLDFLPNSLRPWIQDIAERVQCPPDFPAVGAIISLAAVVGRKIGIRPKRQDDWLEVPNLWGAIVGRPGVLKSPALREALRPLKKLEALAFEGFKAAKADWKRANELHKMKREAERSNIVKALKKPGAAVDPNALADEFAEDEPQARRYVVNDCTVEALGEILKGNPNGTLAYRDELIGLLKSLDKEGNEGARGFFLSAWSGTDAYTFDRIGRGLNMRIEACCLSLLGSIQPSVIGGYLRQAVAGGGGDGLLSRFQLLVWPDVAGDWKDVDRWPDTEAKAKADATFERLDLLDPASIGATVEDGVIPYLRFDSDAQGLFSEWRAGFELRIRGGNDHAAFEAHLAKYRKLVPALALLIHLADSGTGAIGETSLLKALSWAEYLETHARRAYASVTQAEAQSARALLSRIRRNEVPNPFVPRDVYLKHWACLSRPEEVHEAVRLLADLDYLRKEEQATGGRPKGLIWINPKVRAA